MLAKAVTSASSESQERVAIRRNKFVKLAEGRTRTALKAIRTIAKLGNKNAYEYDEADVKKIVNALNREVEALRARMSASGGKEIVDFEL